MDKFKQFYAQAMTDDAVRTEVKKILGKKSSTNFNGGIAMDKFKQFHAQAMTDDAVRAEVKKILGKTPVEDATDDQLIKLGELAKTLGLDISLEEAKAYLAKSHDDEEGELSADELQAVAGGKGEEPKRCVGTRN